MPVQNFATLRGRLEILTVQSDSLKTNLLGDPDTRQVAVYTPAEVTGDVPLLVDIVGFTGSGLAHVGWKAFSESVPQRVDRLIAAGEMAPAIIALPDCFTSLGGNQYVNSAAMGNWADFLVQDMVPAIEARFPVKKGRDHRAIFGKSSGGYGAIVHGMLYADHWGAIACHSGDMDFDLCYRGEFAATVMAMSHYARGIEGFVSSLRDGRKVGGGSMHHLMMLAMAATYDPDPDAPWGIRLPVTMDTCELIPERWNNWLAMDPVRMIEREDVQSNLRSLHGLYIDCGHRDQYNLVFGARQLTRRMTALDIDYEYEEFDDNHSSVDYRMDVSLPKLVAAVS